MRDAGEGAWASAASRGAGLVLAGLVAGVALAPFSGDPGPSPDEVIARNERPMTGEQVAEALDRAHASHAREGRTFSLCLRCFPDRAE